MNKTSHLKVAKPDFALSGLQLLKSSIITIFPTIGAAYYGLLDIQLANCDYVLMLGVHEHTDSASKEVATEMWILRRKVSVSEYLQTLIYSKLETWI